MVMISRSFKSCEDKLLYTDIDITNKINEVEIIKINYLIVLLFIFQIIILNLKFRVVPQIVFEVFLINKSLEIFICHEIFNQIAFP